jgi:hypothetical protein
MTTATPTATRSPMRAALGIMLVVLAVGAVTFGLMREARKSRLAEGPVPTTVVSQPSSISAPPTPAPADPSATSPAGLSTDTAASAGPPITMVYYFHGDTRCPTCLSIEKQASETVQSKFEAEIAAGRLRFFSVNYDTPEHRHFRDDYGLSFGSVVVVKGARFENLSDVWTFVHDDRPKFDAYVVEHVAQFLKADP